MPDTPESSPNPSGCGVCSAPTGDNEYLCRTHTDELKLDLASVPDLVVDLDVTTTRQDRVTGERHGGRSATKPLPFNQHSAECASDLNITLNAWALDVSKLGEDERDPLKPIHHTDTPELARWLIRNIHTLRHNPDAGMATDEITYSIRQARRAIDKPFERVFAGPCNEPLDDGTGNCLEDLYGMPGKRMVTCPACGSHHDMAQRREWMLSIIEDQVAYSDSCRAWSVIWGCPSPRRRSAATPTSAESR